MNLFYDSIQKHLEQLKEKGYDDKSLNAFSGLEGFQAKLLEKIATASDLLTPFDSFVVHDVPLLGFFNKDKEIVLFEFDYNYSVKDQSLSVKAIHVQMNQHRHTFYIGEEYKELPRATELYEYIAKLVKEDLQSKEEMDRAVAQVSPNSRQRITDLVRITADLLQKRGYLTNTPIEGFRDRQTFAKELADILLMSKAQKATSHIFVEHFNTENPSNNMIVGTRLGYLFYPPSISLKPGGLEATMGEHRKLVSVDSLKSLPDANRLFPDFSKKAHVAQSTAIYFHGSKKNSKGNRQKPGS